MLYKDRHDAGIQLAEKLLQYKDENPIIMALPRGGVILGYEVAKKLNAPLDITVARKIGAPSQPELGVGAVAPHGVRILNHGLIDSLGVSELQIEQIIEKESIEMNRQLELYRGNLTPLDLYEKTVIVVDDGIATGVSDKAAVLSVKYLYPKKVILAVPVCPINTAEKFRKYVDEFVCLNEPTDFYAVGMYYENFEQVNDQDVINLLEEVNKNIEPS